MQPKIPILAQSENKSTFLERLGISDQTEYGKRLYAMMKEEAVEGRARISANPNSLIPQFANDPNVHPPYSNTIIKESAIRLETLRIYDHASNETKEVYEFGRYNEGDNEENWIIKWMLWHVFRYRDNRNKGRSMPSWIVRGAKDNTAPSNVSVRPREQPPPPMMHTFYCWPNPTIATPTPEAIDSPLQPSSTKGYWDPVRDAAERTNY